MKRRSLIFILFILLLTLSTSAISNYIIFGNDISGNSSDIIVNGSEDDSYAKVTFYGDNTNYLYVKKRETITIDDIPSSLNNSLIEWKKDSTSGDTILSVLNNGYSDGYVVTQDLNLYSSQIDLTGVMSPTNNEISKDENNPDDDGNINISGNTVKIEEGDNNRNTITEINIDKPIFNNSTIQSTFKDQDGNESVEQTLNKTGSGDTTSYQHTIDQTIGLEDPAETSSYYKPNAGVQNTAISQSNINNCITRIVLQSDTVLANSTLSIGARVGYWRWADNCSQVNFQGFIVGSYNELDLNGRTLVVSSGSTLQMIGSLVDSKGTGKVIVENGGKLITTFVMEDAYHETSIPTAYSLGDAPFKSYRAPYLNATIQFNKGSKFIGNLKIDFGSDSNTNMYQNDLNIIGDGDTYMINTSSCSQNSYIVRNTIWDQTLITSTNNEAGTKKDIVYEKFSFSFYNCDSLVINNPYITSFSLEGVSFQINWDKCDFFIPNYYSFYLYNSKVTIKNNIVFMPGCYLHVDNSSEIILSAKDYGTYSTPSSLLIPNNVLCSDEFYQSVGGLLFVHEKYNYSEMSKYKVAEDSTTLRIFSQTTNFWSYLNKNRQAYADIYGKISFDTSKTLYKELYHLGGLINIYDLDSFIDSVNGASSFVELYNSAFYGGPAHFNLTKVGGTWFNVSDYFGYPLVSQGNVLTSMTSGLGVIGIRSDCKTNIFTYNFDTGVISGNGTAYIPIFMDKSGNYNNWCNHINKTKYEQKKNLWGTITYSVNNWKDDNDDSRLVFNECSYDATNFIATVNGTNYIYFRGGFFKYNGSQVDIYKFRNYDANSGDNTNSYMNVTLRKNDSFYGHTAWRLS